MRGEREGGRVRGEREREKVSMSECDEVNGVMLHRALVQSLPVWPLNS